jgi:hypothetical protein
VAEARVNEPAPFADLCPGWARIREAVLAPGNAIRQALAPIVQVTERMRQACIARELLEAVHRINETARRARAGLVARTQRTDAARRRQRAAAVLARVRQQGRSRSRPTAEVRHVTRPRGRASRAAAADAGDGPSPAYDLIVSVASFPPPRLVLGGVSVSEAVM